MQKPLGIKILAWVMIVFGVLGLGLCIFTPGPTEASGSALGTLYDTTIAVLIIICGTGLLKVQKWAWFGTAAVLVLGLINNVISLSKINQFERQGQIVGLVLGFAVHGLLIAYIMRKDIRGLFQVLK